MGEKAHMLNVLWFVEDGGAEKYAEYAAAAAPFVDELGGRLVESYTPEAALIGEWDPALFFVVEWPDWESFLGCHRTRNIRRSHTCARRLCGTRC